MRGVKQLEIEGCLWLCGQITAPQELPSKKPALYVNKGCVFLVLLRFDLRKLCFTSLTTRRTERIKKVRDTSELLSLPRQSSWGHREPPEEWETIPRD